MLETLTTRVQDWLATSPALAMPSGEGAAPAAVLLSVLSDALSRTSDVKPAALTAGAVALGAAAVATALNLWNSPVYGPYMVLAFAQLESAVWPGAQGAGR